MIRLYLLAGAVAACLAALGGAYVLGRTHGAQRAATKALEAYQETSDAIDNVAVPRDADAALRELCALAGLDECPVQRHPD